MEDARQLLAKQTDHAWLEAAEQGAPEPYDAEVSELWSQLEQYERFKDQLRFPHLDDPLLEPLRTRHVEDRLFASLDGPMGPRRRRRPDDASRALYRAHEKVKTAETMLDVVVEEWHQLENRGPGLTRMGELSSVLVDRLDRERLEALLPPAPETPMAQRILEVLNEDDGRALVNGLTLAELQQVLGSSNQPEHIDDAVDQVLALYSTTSRRELRGHEQMLNYLETTHRALPGMERKSILAAGGELRRLSERYLKQFLAAYGPLSLTSEESTQAHKASLGRLGDWTIRTLKHPNIANSPCDEDPRWKSAQAMLLERASSQQWIANTKKTLDSLRDELNKLAHDVDDLPTTSCRQHLEEAVKSGLASVEALLYPVCLRYHSLEHDTKNDCWYIFDQDPSGTLPRKLTFSKFPVPWEQPDFWKVLVNRIIVMVPLAGYQKIDPLLATVTPI